MLQRIHRWISELLYGGHLIQSQQFFDRGDLLITIHAGGRQHARILYVKGKEVACGYGSSDVPSLKIDSV
ncbi:MAG TPA: hypothetical protein VF088_13195 [Pyrinomonadaceae bacterium]